jgi:hypothetical protein
MGLMIVAGLAVIAVTMFNRLQQAGVPKPPPPPPAAAASAVLAPMRLPHLGTLRVPLTGGCRIVAMQTSGERLLVQVGGINVECDRIIIFDLASGDMLGEVRTEITP